MKSFAKMFVPPTYNRESVDTSSRAMKDFLGAKEEEQTKSPTIGLLPPTVSQVSYIEPEPTLTASEPEPPKMIQDADPRKRKWWNPLASGYGQYRYEPLEETYEEVAPDLSKPGRIPPPMVTSTTPLQTLESFQTKTVVDPRAQGIIGAPSGQLISRDDDEDDVTNWWEK